MIHVEFTDETETVIKASYAGPQDPADHPYMGEVEEDDPRYLAFLAQFPPNNPWG
jgi:hypothetical protein